MNTAYVKKIFYRNKNKISKAMDSPGIGICGIKRNKFLKRITQFFKKKRNKNIITQSTLKRSVLYSVLLFVI